MAEGDVIVVWKLDRLSRSLKDLLHILEKIDAGGPGQRPQGGRRNMCATGCDR
ncbi:MAG: recombinase family protein [Stellaceae bacterium]